MSWTVTDIARRLAAGGEELFDPAPVPLVVLPDGETWTDMVVSVVQGMACGHSGEVEVWLPGTDEIDDGAALCADCLFGEDEPILARPEVLEPGHFVSERESDFCDRCYEGYMDALTVRRVVVVSGDGERVFSLYVCDECREALDEAGTTGL